MGFPSGLGGDIPISFMALFSGTPNLSASVQRMNFQTVIHDVYGVYDAANSRFNVTLSGVYYIFFNVASNSGPGKYIRFYINGVDIFPAMIAFGTVGNFNLGILHYLQAGDYVEVWGAADSNAAMIGWGNFGAFMVR